MAALSGIRPGDIVEVDKKGRRFHAVVTATMRGALEVEPLTRDTYRTASAREVKAHWRRAGRRTQ